MSEDLLATVQRKDGTTYLAPYPDLTDPHGDVINALQKLVDVLTDLNHAGCYVDGRWMGSPDWALVDAAVAALEKARGTK